MRKSTLYMTLAYFCAIVVALIAGYIVRDENTFVIILVADIAGTLAIFIFSVIFRNSSFYDPYWSLAPIAIAVSLLFWPTDVETNIIRQIMVTTLVIAWGLRLTYNFARGWISLDHEDWRYGDLQRSTGSAYWLVSLTGIHLFPTILVYLGCLPLISALSTSAEPLSRVDAAAFFITLAAIWIEASSDQQLRNFKNSNPSPRMILKDGWWARSRHPNYFGEMTFWWGLALFGIASSAPHWSNVAGAISITLLFVFVSLPMIERRHHRRKDHYKEYVTNTPVLIPKLWLRTKNSR